MSQTVYTDFRLFNQFFISNSFLNPLIFGGNVKLYQSNGIFPSRFHRGETGRLYDWRQLDPMGARRTVFYTTCFFDGIVTIGGLQLKFFLCTCQRSRVTCG